MKAASLFAVICAVTFSLSSTQIALALPDKAIEPKIQPSKSASEVSVSAKSSIPNSVVETTEVRTTTQNTKFNKY
jgi:hypothetical protein